MGRAGSYGSCPGSSERLVDKSFGHHSTHSAPDSIESPPTKTPWDSVEGPQEGTSSRPEPGDLWELLLCLFTYIFYTWLTWLGVSYMFSLNVEQIGCGSLT